MTTTFPRAVTPRAVLFPGLAYRLTRLAADAWALSINGTRYTFARGTDRLTNARTWLLTSGPIRGLELGPTRARAVHCLLTLHANAEAMGGRTHAVSDA